MKKCIEKGVQVLVFEINPHSKGDNFSLSLFSFILKLFPIIATKLLISKLSVKIETNKIICAQTEGTHLLNDN